MEVLNQTSGQTNSSTLINDALRRKLIERLSHRYEKRVVSEWDRWRREYPKNPEKSRYVGLGMSMMDDIGIPHEIYELMDRDLKKELEEVFDEFNPEKTIAQIDEVASEAVRRLFSKHMRKITD